MWLRIKIFVSNILYFFKKKYNLFVFQKHIRHEKNFFSAISIFDLDNTLANTFPLLKNYNLKKVYEIVEPHQGMLALFMMQKNQDKRLCLILTARQFKYRQTTENWIKSNLQSDLNSLFIVPSAFDKLPYLKIAKKYFKHINYYDDLSYNHENYDIKFYDSMISEVQKMKINYFGYNDIMTINSQK